MTEKNFPRLMWQSYNVVETRGFRITDKTKLNTINRTGSPQITVTNV